MEIEEFLEARIAEDEDLAMRSIQVGEKGAALVSFGSPDAEPVLIVHPERVLAECAMKRAIIANTPPASCSQVHPQFDVYHPDGHVSGVLLAMAALYMDHPDFRVDWVLRRG